MMGSPRYRTWYIGLEVMKQFADAITVGTPAAQQAAATAARQIASGFALGSTSSLAPSLASSISNSVTASASLAGGAAAASNKDVKKRLDGIYQQLWEINHDSTSYGGNTAALRTG